MSKPIVIFTNFNDALNLISNNDLLITNNKKLYRVILNNNFDILSITLPLKDKKYKGKQIKTLNCLIPTVKLFVKLQTHKNWSKFIEDYKDILKERKNKILAWINSLEDNRVYLCCCVETTVNGVECHRKYLYDIFSNGIVKDKAIWVYRNGIKTNVKDEDDGQEKEESISEISNDITRPTLRGRTTSSIIFDEFNHIDQLFNQGVTFRPSSVMLSGNIVRIEITNSISNIYPGDMIYMQSDGTLSTRSTMSASSPIGTIIGIDTGTDISRELVRNYIVIRLNDNYNQQFREYIDDYL